MIAGTLIGCENASSRFSDVWASTPEFCIANGMKCFDAILRENYESDVDIECQEMARRFLLYFHADYKAADDGMSSSTQIAWLCDEHYYLCVEMNHLKQLLREQLDDGDLCLEAQHEYGKCFPHHSVL
jgi:hypothetical protein